MVTFLFLFKSESIKGNFHRDLKLFLHTNFSLTPFSLRWTSGSHLSNLQLHQDSMYITHLLNLHRWSSGISTNFFPYEPSLMRNLTHVESMANWAKKDFRRCILFCEILSRNIISTIMKRRVQATENSLAVNNLSKKVRKDPKECMYMWVVVDGKQQHSWMHLLQHHACTIYQFYQHLLRLWNVHRQGGSQWLPVNLAVAKRRAVAYYGQMSLQISDIS